jgi:cell division protein FtsB
MFDFHEKRKIQRYLFSKPLIGIIFVIAGLLSFSVYDRYVVSKEMQMKLDEKYAELKKLEVRAESLSEKVKYLSDERGIEEELRSRFDVAKEGEQVVVLLDSKRDQKVVSESIEGQGAENAPKESFLQKLIFWD